MALRRTEAGEFVVLSRGVRSHLATIDPKTGAISGELPAGPDAPAFTSVRRGGSGGTHTNCFRRGTSRGGKASARKAYEN